MRPTRRQVGRPAVRVTGVWRVLAIVAVGAGHLVGLGLAAGLAVTTLERQLLLTGETALPGEVGAVLIALLLAAVCVAAGSAAAAWLAGHARPLARGCVAVAGGGAGVLLAIATGLVIAGFVDVGSWQPPMVGAGIGVQFAIVLPPDTPLRALARIGAPVIIDVIAWLAMATVFSGGWTIGWLVAWFGLGCLIVALLETVVRPGRAPPRPAA